MRAIQAQTAVEALTDVLVDYNVPTQQIVAEFLKLITDSAYSTPSKPNGAIQS